MEHIYQKLFFAYGSQGWWPITPKGEAKPRYGIGIQTPLHRFEIAVGAILTQNTAWGNAEKAIAALHDEQFLAPEKILAATHKKIARLVHSAGYFNQKAERLKILAKFFLSTDITKEEVTSLRTKLLGLKGIGPETADSIILYAAEKPVFVIDAYTKRIFSRMGYHDEDANYDNWQQLFHSALPQDTQLFNEYHALIVEHAKRSCRKVPLCETCILAAGCKKRMHNISK